MSAHNTHLLFDDQHQKEKCRNKENLSLHFFIALHPQNLSGTHRIIYFTVDKV